MYRNEKSESEVLKGDGRMYSGNADRVLDCFGDGFQGKLSRTIEYRESVIWLKK